MDAVATVFTVRVLSCDAKVIGSLVGGCRVTVRHRDTGEVLAQGLHLGGSGDTEKIMKSPPPRGEPQFSDSDTAFFRTEIAIAEPTPLEITAEGPLAHPGSRQTATATTWLIPGEHMNGDGIVLKMYGFIVGIMTPTPADVFQSEADVHLQAHVHLL